LVVGTNEPVAPCVAGTQGAGGEHGPLLETVNSNVPVAPLKPCTKIKYAKPNSEHQLTDDLKPVLPQESSFPSTHAGAEQFGQNTLILEL
jgi:hypothetical protein